MNPAFFSRIFVISLVLASVAGVFFYLEQGQYTKSAKQCDIDGMHNCSVMFKQQPLSVQFLTPIELEEELIAKITVPTTLSLENIWAQGVNMYMGKAAVIVTLNKETIDSRVYKSKLFLGACSEPNMRWQLVVQAKDVRGKIHSYFFNFQTHY